MLKLSFSDLSSGGFKNIETFTDEPKYRKSDCIFSSCFYEILLSIESRELPQTCRSHFLNTFTFLFHHVVVHFSLPLSALCYYWDFSSMFVAQISWNQLFKIVFLLQFHGLYMWFLGRWLRKWTKFVYDSTPIWLDNLWKHMCA